MIGRLRNGIAHFKQCLSCERFQARLLRSLSTSASLPPDGLPLGLPHDEANARLKVLLIVAHPDDESECAAFLYRVTHEFGGTVDQVVVTNGEGGLEYSAPGRAYYKCAVNENAWRKQLVGIRRRELLAAGRVLGLRSHYFLEQTDTGFTLDAGEGFRAWNTHWIQQGLFGLFQREKYDLVILLLPTIDTHGHHKTVALLTLEVIEDLDDSDRPAALGVRTLGADEAGPEPFLGLDGYPRTRTALAKPVWVFDRRTPMECHRTLDYRIISNWVIAEHKSQGAFQMELGRRVSECFWLFEACGESGLARWRESIDRIEPWKHSSANIQASHEFSAVESLAKFS